LFFDEIQSKIKHNIKKANFGKYFDVIFKADTKNAFSNTVNMFCFEDLKETVKRRLLLEEYTIELIE